MFQVAEFTPWSALTGGLLIGLAALLLLVFNGRVAGISGILNMAMQRPKGDSAWRWLFVLGLLLGAGGWVWLAGLSFELREGFPLWLLAVAGFLVGIGTRMGGGCTSGHGVCGISRLSQRSIVATGVFMLVAVITTYVVRHIAGVGV